MDEGLLRDLAGEPFVFTGFYCPFHTE